MGFVSKFSETSKSVLPIVILVLFMHFTCVTLPFMLLLKFMLGAVLVVVGLSVFLQGVEVGIIGVGQHVGVALTKKKNLFLLLTVSFAVGFFITIAEPDVQVLASQFINTTPNVNKLLFILSIALGVGVFVSVGLCRMILRLPINILFTVLYIIIFVIAAFVPTSYIGISFDAGGATTGPMTVPFIMALGVGVSATVKEKNTFGLTGVSSVGPILSVLLFSLFISNNTYNSPNVTNFSSGAFVISPLVENEGLEVFLYLLGGVVKEVGASLIPLVFLFILFEVFLLRMPPIKLARVFVGLIYSFIGLVFFLLGVKGGFMKAASGLGLLLSDMASGGNLKGKIILLLTGLLLGAVTVCAEPAVYVLTSQVEEASSGVIKRRLLLPCLAFGVAMAVALSLFRNMVNLSLWNILIVGYILSIILCFFTPTLFVGIAFDSGGVASGPMTSTFILSFVIGTCNFNASDAFGLISLVALAPIITIELLGVAYKIHNIRHKVKVNRSKNID